MMKCTTAIMRGEVVMIAVTLLNFWTYSSYLITCSLVLNFFKQLGAECRLTLTPSTAESLCPGDQLMLTCNTSTDVHQWTIDDPNTGMMHTRLIAVPTNSRAQAITSLEVQSFIFSFAVVSAPNTLPLISTLTVDDVTDYLNTSRISCLERNTESSEIVNIHILGSNTLEGVHMDYHLVSTWFGINNATVIIQFNESSQENDYHGLLISYLNVTSSSEVELQTEERTRFQLVVPYNTQVNVSIIASLCGQHRILTIIQLFYTNCGYPPVQQSKNIIMEMTMNDPLRITSDIQDIMPVMEGFHVSFSCHSEFKLSGPNLSTCMKNGEWEPNPREVECKQKVNCGPPSTPQYGHVYPFTSTLEGADVVFSCREPIQESFLNLTSVCSDNGIWSPNPRNICAKHSNQSGMEESTGMDAVLVGIIASSVTLALTTVICFIIGVMSGRVSTNFTDCAKPSRAESVTTNYNMATDPVYEDIMPQEMRPSQNDEFQENIAYITKNSKVQ